MKPLLPTVLLSCAISAANPLLEKKYPTPFAQIRAEHVAPAAESLLAEAQKKRETFIASRGPRTFENTLVALVEIGEDLSRAMSAVNYVNGVATTPELRAAINEVLPKVSAFSSSVTLDPAIYAKLKEYAGTAEAKSLTGARKRLLERTLDAFRRNGAEVGAKEKERLKAIDIEVAQIGRKFADNVLDSTNAFEIVIKDEAKLAGLPESARAAARQSAKQKGVDGWRFTLQAPSLRAVLAYLDDAAVRERMYRANVTKAASGAQDNRPIMRRTLELRREQARILGYRTYADFMTEERMAKSGERVREFLVDLERRTRPFYERENKELHEFRKSIEGPNAPPLQPWDVAYYGEKMRKARYDLDEEAVRPYFPLDKVFKGMFGLVERLYGIRIVKADAGAVWDPAVEYFELRDGDGTLLGSFYTDFFPRENKRGGAWAAPLIHGGPFGAVFQPHLGSINGNVNAPTGDAPALLTHSEVETVFHEFGHLISFLLARVPVKGLDSVAWDFVELPSQIMENFTWRRECLDMFARHYKTGEPIPEDLFRKMLRARTYRAASAQMGQLGYATMDLMLHTDYRGERDGDIVAYGRKILQRFTPAPLPEDFAMVAGFSHIFAGGYAAGYYSYKWAEVLDADAFTRFEKEGILNPRVGAEFRKKILEKADSEDAGALFRDFMGRDPDPGALLRRNGLQ